jgi:hypothetical protein
LVVWQDGYRLRAEEVVVPNGEKAKNYREIPLKWRGAEVFIHLMKSIEHGAEVLRADCEHGREADGGIHRVAPADPIPKLKHVRGVDPKFATSFAFVETATKCRATDF